MRSEFMVKRETPVSKTGCHEVVKVHARAIAQRAFHEPIVRKSIGAEVTGMTACPCAQNIMAEHAAQVLHRLGISNETAQQFFDQVPMATHNQRGRGFLCIEVDDDEHVDLETIITILKDSMSARTYRAAEARRRVGRRDGRGTRIPASSRTASARWRRKSSPRSATCPATPGSRSSRRTRSRSTSTTPTPSARRRWRSSWSRLGGEREHPFVTAHKKTTFFWPDPGSRHPTPLRPRTPTGSARSPF